MNYTCLPEKNTDKTTEISSRITLVTPEYAGTLLDSQGQNRNIRFSHVEQLARDMSAGKWIIGDPIKLDNNGSLIDGQHRLLAVIKSKTSQYFLILSGYLPESKQVLDTGLRRSAANIGQILGKDITQTDEATINVLYLPGSSIKLTTTERLTIYDIYKEGIKFANKQEKRKDEYGLTAVVRALIAKAYYYENHERLEQFCQTYQTGHVIIGNEDSSAVALRNYRIKIKTGNVTINTYVGREMFYLAAQESLEKFIKRQIIKKILFKEREAIDRYPIPHIHKNWEKYCKRYKAISSTLINADINSEITRLYQEAR